MPHRFREVRDSLIDKFGFSVPTGRSSDHKWVELVIPGLPVIATRVSHGRGEIGRKLEGKIARQVRVRNQFFRGMIDCTNSSEEYQRQVREDPYPPWDHRF
jgi:hypothetical protein